MDTFISGFFNHSPAFDVINAPAKKLAWCDWPDRDAYYHALSSLCNIVQFVDAQPEQAYEMFVAETGQVPTRYGNWHDYFNALIWATYPRIKMQLNVWHQHHWASGVRNRQRDGLTLFDESGVIVFSRSSERLQAIQQMRWPTVFLDKRAMLAQELRVSVFGHGLLEKCLQPYIGLTAHALLIELTDVQWQYLSMCHFNTAAQEDLLLSVLNNELLLAPDNLYPLPVLGLPGWYPGNDEESFYANKHYFRERRFRQKKQVE